MNCEQDLELVQTFQAVRIKSGLPKTNFLSEMGDEWQQLAELLRTGVYRTDI